MTLEERYAKLSRAEIRKWIEERRGEDLHLDFKRVGDETVSKTGSKKELAIAISGFANSDGGLIVWGIDTTKDVQTRTDHAATEEPLNDARSFVARLHELTGDAVNPTVDGVDHRAIDGGFAVTLVPASDSGPHMAKFSEDRYYKRNGSSFRRMEHFDIGDMFGRRARPDLSIWLGDFKWKGDKLTFPLGIENKGRGPAIAPVLLLRAHEPLIERNVHRRPLDLFLSAEPEWRHLAGGRDVVLHQHGKIVVATYRVDLDSEEFRSRKNRTHFQIDFRVSAEGAELKTGTIEEAYPST